MKLLIVDDDQVIHLSFTKPMTENGFEVLNAYDGRQAINMVWEHMPDIILLDLTLPEIDGRDVCKKIKNSPETSHIKIIMLTAKEEQHDRLLGLKLGADEYIAKPCTIGFLERVIKKVMKKM